MEAASRFRVLSPVGIDHRDLTAVRLFFHNLAVVIGDHNSRKSGKDQIPFHIVFAKDQRYMECQTIRDTLLFVRKHFLIFAVSLLSVAGNAESGTGKCCRKAALPLLTS